MAVQLTKTISDLVVARKQPFSADSARTCVQSGKEEHLRRYLQTLNAQVSTASPGSTPPTRKRWVTAHSPEEVTFSPRRQETSPESQVSSPPSAGACAQALDDGEASADNLGESQKLLQVRVRFMIWRLLIVLF